MSHRERVVDAEPPQRMRGLRACLRCRLLKTLEQFRSEGCNNCGTLFVDPLADTTPVFKGVIAMMQPETSWVAKWHKQERSVRGLYAMQVVGELLNEEELMDDDEVL